MFWIEVLTLRKKITFLSKRMFSIVKVNNRLIKSHLFWPLLNFPNGIPFTSRLSSVLEKKCIRSNGLENTFRKKSTRVRTACAIRSEETCMRSIGLGNPFRKIVDPFRKRIVISSNGFCINPYHFCAERDLIKTFFSSSRVQQISIRSNINLILSHGETLWRRKKSSCHTTFHARLFLAIRLFWRLWEGFS